MGDSKKGTARGAMGHCGAAADRGYLEWALIGPSTPTAPARDMFDDVLAVLFGGGAVKNSPNIAAQSRQAVRGPSVSPPVHPTLSDAGPRLHRGLPRAPLRRLRETPRLSGNRPGLKVPLGVRPRLVVLLDLEAHARAELPQVID